MAVRLPALALALLLAACSRQDTARETLSVFGQTAEIELRGSDPANNRAALAAASEHLAALHREWHAWQPSPLTAINEAIAAGEDAPAPPSILELIARSRPLVQAGDGLFDPSIGSLVALWGFHSDAYPITTPAPDAATIAQWLASRPRFDDVYVENGRVGSRNPAVQLDFGAIGNGLALEQLSRQLSHFGIRHALIRLGSDLLALGDAGGRPWVTTVSDPFGGILAEIDLGDGEALLASGNYRRFRDDPDGGRWPHVLDPRTGYPTRGTALVAVIHPDPVLADAASTMLMIGGPAQFAVLAERLGLGCALMLTEENELLLTAAMQPRLRLRRNPVALGAPVETGRRCSPQD